MLVLPWSAKADDNTNSTNSATEYTNPQYTALASQMVGKGTIITVHCTSAMPEDYLGYTIPIMTDNTVSGWEQDIYLQKYVCYSLGELLHYTKKHYVKSSTWQDDKESRMGQALLTIVHEVGHIRTNSINEGYVECWAVHHLKYYLNWFKMPSKVAHNVYLDALLSHRMAPAVYLTVC